MWLSVFAGLLVLDYLEGPAMDAAMRVPITCWNCRGNVAPIESGLTGQIFCPVCGAMNCDDRGGDNETEN